MSTAVITENTVELPATTIAGQIDRAYTALTKQIQAEVKAVYKDRADFQAMEADLIAFTSFLEELGIDPEEFFLGETEAKVEPEILVPLTYLGSSHKARSMTRCGRRYKVRKDHGTKVFYREIEAANLLNEEAKQRSGDSVRSRRKARKHEARSGDPRYKAPRS